MYCPSCGKEIPDESAFCLKCGKAILVTAQSAGRTAAASPAPISEPKKKPSFTIFVLGALGLFCLVGIAIVNESKRPAIPGEPQTTVAPALTVKTDTLTTGSMAIAAGQMRWIQFLVKPGVMIGTRVSGRFSASGGSGNDIEVLLADEDNFTNWRNRHPAQVLYQSGKVTVGEIDVPISTPGNYYLVFNNAFSGFSAKTVEANVQLRYQLRAW